jgi:phage gp36-like protein
MGVGIRRVRCLDAERGGAMTTPAASGTLYASVADLRNVMSGTDSGTGTAAQLTDAQLELALYSASNRVSVYAGNVFDGSTPAANPPAILHDLTLDLARFWAAVTYLKFKAIETTSPTYIAYMNATQMLNDVRDGKILLDPAPAPGIGDETGVVINRIPPVFTGRDSNVRIDPLTGVLEADSPFWTPRTGGLVDGGPVYGGG